MEELVRNRERERERERERDGRVGSMHGAGEGALKPRRK
jgi:hypothetical protein